MFHSIVSYRIYRNMCLISRTNFNKVDKTVFYERTSRLDVFLRGSPTNSQFARMHFILLILIIFAISSGQPQPEPAAAPVIVTGETGKHMEKSYHKSCEKGNEIVSCNDETFERFGCCFKLEDDGGQPHHKWDTYEDIRGIDHKDLIPIEYCDPAKPIDDQCNTPPDISDLKVTPPNYTSKGMKELFKERGEEVICAPLTPTTIKLTNKIYAGRCRSVKERQALKSDFYGKRFYIRADWVSKRFAPNRKRRECNLEEFQRKGIRELIERFLLCPFDTEYLDKEFHKLLEEAYFLPRMLEDLCLASPNLEECVPYEENDVREKDATGKCVCYQKTWRIRRKDDVFIWNLTQLDERHKCTQAAGNACTFNAKDMIALDNTQHLIPKANPNGEYSPDVLYGRCDVKGEAVKKMEIIPDLVCEQDAACSSVLEPRKKCLAAKDCKCVCAVGHECSKSGGAGPHPLFRKNGRGVVWSFWSGILTLFFLGIFWHKFANWE